MPTWPRPPSTTTSAVNENQPPPLTTLATRSMDTTRAVSSGTLGSIVASDTYGLLTADSKHDPAPPFRPRHRPGPAHAPPNPPMSEVARHAPLLRDHFAAAPAFLPTLRRTTSSAYLMPLPLYGSGLRSMRSFEAVWPSRALSAPRRVMSVCLSISAVTPSGSGKITGCE